MGLALDEFFAAVEDEFGLAIDAGGRELLATPGDVIDFILEQSQGDEADEERRRDQVAGVVDELLSRVLGITRYDEGSRFLQDLRVR